MPQSFFDTDVMKHIFIHCVPNNTDLSLLYIFFLNYYMKLKVRATN